MVSAYGLFSGVSMWGCLFEGVSVQVFQYGVSVWGVCLMISVWGV